MKIISLHIENFGKLHDYNLNLEDGLNIIKEDNGWGKSTLAAFIRAMFYGFEGDLKRIQGSERKRFKPWQGGAYGGTLRFETKGTEYIIERIFGSKAIEDTFVLRTALNNAISDKFSSNIGEELFHINRESFLKTVFISQNDCASNGSTDDINSRIGNISDSTDLNKFEAADKALKDAVNHLGTTATGRQGKLKNEISDKKGTILRGSDIPVVMDEIMNRISEREEVLEEIKSENRELSEKRNKVSKASKKIALRKTYDSLVNEISDKASNLEELKQWFPGKIPESERLSQWEDALENMGKKNAVMDSNEFSGVEQSAYESLSDMFKNGMPDDDELKVMSDKAVMLNDMRVSSARYQMSPEDEEKCTYYDEIFGGEDEPAAKIKKLNIEWANCTGLKHKKETLEVKVNDRLNEISAALSDRKKKRLIVLIFMAVIFIISAFLFVISLKNVDAEGNNIFKIISMSTGVVSGVFSVVTAILLVRTDKETVYDEETEKYKQEIEEIDAEISGITENIHKYLEGHGYNVQGEEYSGVLMNAYEEAALYTSLVERRKKFAENDRTKEALILSSEISGYLERFNINSSEENFASDIAAVKGKKERYFYLENKINEYKKAQKTYGEIKDGLNEQLKQFGFSPMLNLEGQLEEIERHIREVKDAESFYNEAASRKKRFEDENDMDEILAPVSDDELLPIEEIERLQAELDVKKAEIEANLKTDRVNLEGYKEKYENLLDEKEELKNLEEELERVKEKHRLYGLTREYLNKSRESLTTRYIGPLKEGFDKYYHILTGTAGDDFKLDANLVLTKTEQGGQRNTDSLSYGYQDLCGLCMRLSMADSMYKGEKPVLICDDPFVNLDDGKMEGSKKLINEVSGEYQIIYMTCRENRM